MVKCSNCGWNNTGGLRRCEKCNAPLTFDVFISYSRKDYVDDAGNVLSNNILLNIKDNLKASGISYWFDEEGIYSGDEFASVITNAIRNSRIFLFISSVNSNQSRWTSNEISTALEFEKPIIPFRIDNSPYNDSVMMKIVSFDYIQCNDVEKAISKLLRAIKHHMPSSICQQKKSVIDVPDGAKGATVTFDVEGKRTVKVFSYEGSEAKQKEEIERRNAEKLREDAKLRNRREKQKKQFEDAFFKYFHRISWRHSIGFVTVFVIFTIIFFNHAKILHFFNNSLETADAVSTPECILPEDTIESVVAVDYLETVVTKTKIPSDYILIPKGNYTKDEYDEKLQKENQVRVTVDSFYICKSELTQGEYVRIMGDIEERNYRFEVTTDYPSQFKNFKDEQLPVLGTYIDFVRYCNKRSEEEGYDGFYTLDGNTVVYKPGGNGYRLLSEDEWAFAALSGKNKPRYKYIGGDRLTEVAWYGGNSGNKPHKVCLKKPNDIGLYDMAGNVDEMLQSTYNGNHLLAGNSFLHWSYSGREFNEKSNSRFQWKEGNEGTRIALIPKNFSKD